MSSVIELKEPVPQELAFQRLDQVVAIMFPEYSRSRLQTWIKSGELLVDGQVRRIRDKVTGGELIEVQAVAESLVNEPQAMPLDIVFEDDSIIVINKPVGLIVHPGAGNSEGTMLNGLLAHWPALAEVPRAGIVHRLDKDTSGLLVIAKTLPAQTSLVNQLQDRSVHRVYQSVVYGLPPVVGTVDAPISRHPTVRTRMTVIEGGKEAITHYRRLDQFEHFAHMEFRLETGRTHQIRVHMQHINFPLVGDSVYGGSLRIPSDCPEGLSALLRAFNRQALHALELSFLHPQTNEQVSFCAELPDDMRALLASLRNCFGQ